MCLTCHQWWIRDIRGKPVTIPIEFLDQEFALLPLLCNHLLLADVDFHGKNLPMWLRNSSNLVGNSNVNIPREYPGISLQIPIICMYSRAMTSFFEPARVRITQGKWGSAHEKVPRPARVKWFAPGKMANASTIRAS